MDHTMRHAKYTKVKNVGASEFSNQDKQLRGRETKGGRQRRRDRAETICIARHPLDLVAMQCAKLENMRRKTTNETEDADDTENRQREDNQCTAKRTNTATAKSTLQRSRGSYRRAHQGNSSRQRSEEGDATSALVRTTQHTHTK